MKEGLTRRWFLRKVVAWLGMGVASSLGLQQLTGCSQTAERPTPTATLKRVPTSTPRPLHEAMFYRTLADDLVQCQVCFRKCIVREGQLGFCYNKKNVEGKYYSLVYGRPCTLQIDPIEKEPAFHMLPGAAIFCTGTASCNQRCKFCQNWEMSQQKLWEMWNLDASPEEVVEMALEEGCDAVSFTYNEPTVFYEQMFDTAKLAKEKGLRALFHTNGTMNPEPLFALLEVMDAVTVDLKAFTSEFYQRVCSSELWPVLRTLSNVRKAGKHLEIVSLVIPTKNDDPEDIRQMCVWIRENLGDEIPLHFIRFFPAYKYQRFPPTPIETLEEAAGIADEEGLQYVYIGNVPGHERNSTFCPGCEERIIHRVHFAVLSMEIEHGKCRFCGHEVPGIW
jgi:pyruvate formate lyase activating enzyme